MAQRIVFLLLGKAFTKARLSVRLRIFWKTKRFCQHGAKFVLNNAFIDPQDEQWTKTYSSCLWYIGEYTTQVYFWNHDFWIPIQQPGFNGKYFFCQHISTRWSSSPPLTRSIELMAAELTELPYPDMLYHEVEPNRNNPNWHTHRIHEWYIYVHILTFTVQNQPGQPN